MYRIKRRVIAAAVLLAFLLPGCAEQQVLPEPISSENTVEQFLSQYADACAAASQGDYLNSMLLFASLGDWEDARERYLETGYAYAEQLLDEGDLLAAISYFEFVRTYEDAETRILDTKSLYIQQHLDLNDVITCRLLCDKELRQRPEVRAIHQQVCTWEAEILYTLIGESDGTNIPDPLGKKDCFYVELLLKCSLPGDTTDLLLKLDAPDGTTFSQNYSDMSSEHGLAALQLKIPTQDNKTDGTWRITVFDEYSNPIGSTTFLSED